MTARHATSDAAHDLVADRVETVGPVLGLDGLGPVGPVLRPDQHHLVADAHAIVAAVDQHLVHGDHADDRAPPPTDQHLTARLEQASGHPVGVPDRDGGHGGVTLEGVPQPVGDAAARRHPLHVRHPRPQRHAPGATRRTVRRRRDPVRCRRSRCRRARTTVVRPGGRSLQRSSQCARASPVGRSRCVEGRVEPGELGGGERVVGLVGDCEVGEDAGEHEHGRLPRRVPQPPRPHRRRALRRAASPCRS